MAFEVPHKHDISVDGQEMRNQMIENFEAIEKAINDLRGRIGQLDERINKIENLLKEYGMTEEGTK